MLVHLLLACTWRRLLRESSSLSSDFIQAFVERLSKDVLVYEVAALTQLVNLHPEGRVVLDFTHKLRCENLLESLACGASEHLQFGVGVKRNICFSPLKAFTFSAMATGETTLYLSSSFFMNLAM